MPNQQARNARQSSSNDHGRSKARLQVPKNWPSSVTYLRTLRYSTTLSSESLQSLRRSVAPAHQARVLQNPPSPCQQAHISPIVETAHPACGQHGLFAAKHLEPDALVLFYIGLVHGPEQANPQSDYDLSFDRELGIGIDADHMGNEGRFINDYRGVADASNAEFRDCWVGIGDHFEKRIGVFVHGTGKSGKRARGIEKGEEILVSYGKGFWTKRLDSDSGDQGS